MKRLPSLTQRPARILDFDIENRPLSYLGMDFTTGEVTSIAASWIGSEDVEVWLLTTDPDSAYEMLKGFHALYRQADMVTGHYIRGHDLPVIQGALMELELPLLSSKLVQDTKCDLVRRRYLSASQESLAGMYGLANSKEHMSQPQWREANRLTPQGIKETRRRVIGDVLQHKQLRNALLKAGALKPPSLWKP